MGYSSSATYHTWVSNDGTLGRAFGFREFGLAKRVGLYPCSSVKFDDAVPLAWVYCFLEVMEWPPAAR